MKKISTKMLCSILPVIILAFVLLTSIAAINSERVLSKEIANGMNSTLEARAGEINSDLEAVKTTARVISRTVAGTYRGFSLEKYEDLLKTIISDNDMVLGSGIWFAPYEYNTGMEYCGPYIYKDGGDIVVTYDYSNAEYDYFNQEYYTIAQSNKDAVITNPYYDATSGLVMSTCTMPIFDKERFAGCISVDVELSSLTSLIDGITVGENGRAILIDTVGTFLAGVDEDKVSSGVNIATDEQYGAIAADILANSEGVTYGTLNGEKYTFYYETVSASGWKIIIQMPNSELNQPIVNMVTKLSVVSVIALLLTIVIIVIQINSVTRAIKKTEQVVEIVSTGDLTVEIDDALISRNDELGSMAKATRELVERLREIAIQIQQASRDVLHAGDELSSVADQSSQTADDISSAIDDISKGAVSQAEDVENATGEVSQMGDIIEQITFNVGKLNETSATMQAEGDESSRIMKELEAATNMTVEGIKKVSVNIEATDESVHAITEAVNLITGIASQTNLLSLNASIEAARAGEAGRGFAVVASEIQHLSEESSNSAGRIAQIVKQLSADSRTSLEVMEEVKVELANTQAKLAETIEKFSMVSNGIISSKQDTGYINTQATDCGSKRDRIVDIIQNLSAVSEENAASTEETTAAMQELNATINILAGSAEELKDLAVKLEENTQFFKL